jgi:hypothetical protein
MKDLSLFKKAKESNDNSYCKEISDELAKEQCINIIN